MTVEIESKGIIESNICIDWLVRKVMTDALNVLYEMLRLNQYELSTERVNIYTDWLR